MKKLGTFEGVFVPSFEAILGAVVFLLLPHLTGEMGLLAMLGIVTVANLVTLSTGYSIADCTTNLSRVGSGGLYALSKGSLGKAFGGSIGIQLFLAQAASIGFYSIGFATPLQSLIQEIPLISDWVQTSGATPLLQKQIIASLFAFIGIIAGLIGADFVVKIQMVIFVLLIISVISFFVAPLFGLTFSGLPVFTGNINWGGEGTQFTFWTALIVFFPAVTGIDAGVGMSGSLKDPRKSLVRGTFAAIGITFFTYAALTVLFSFINPQFLVRGASGIPNTVLLFQDNPILQGILTLGILFATGSSALAYFLTAPHTLQAITKDQVLPKFLSFFERDFFKGGHEPRFAALLTFGISLGVIWSGDVDISSRLVGMAFLVVYGWINLAAFFERASGNPSFRPTSKGHWAISLGGYLLATAILFLDNLVLGLGVIAFQLTLFVLILKFKTQNRLEGVWWGLLFSWINAGMKSLKKIIQGTKNWRPMVGLFVFEDCLKESQSLMEMGKRIGQFKGLVSVNILVKKGVSEETRATWPGEATPIYVPTDDFGSLILGLLQAALPGGLHLNTAILPLDNRLNLSYLVEQLILLKKNILLQKAGTTPFLNQDNRIDVWWKGEENGNLMALLANMISDNDSKQGRKSPVRLIRTLLPSDHEEEAIQELTTLRDDARLNAEVVTYQTDGKNFQQLLREKSQDASLIILGMPGKQPGNLARFFRLDKMLFEKEIKAYEGLPPILFVKAAEYHNLVED